MDPMFRHILVPLDFTHKNNAALEFAQQIAQQSQARVTLLHVIEKIPYADDEDTTNFYQMLRERAQANLLERLDGFKESDVSTSVSILMGKTAPSILSYSLSEEVDLIIMSSHKVRFDETPQGFASLSYQVSILCQCPVLLVK